MGNLNIEFRTRNVQLRKEKKVFDLEDRLIDFAVRMIAAESLPKNKVRNPVSGQRFRSGTASVANYGEAQSEESRADFTHNWVQA